MKKEVILVAGGSGERMKSRVPKQFLELGGKPILMRTIEKFLAFSPEIKIVLVLPKAHFSLWRELCEKHEFFAPVEIVAGGESRFESVKNGLALVADDALVAVHDGVRPLLSAALIGRGFEAAAAFGTAVPVVAMTDSLRRRKGAGSVAVNRAEFFAVQTPQTFHADLLKRAYNQPFNETFTDDASVVEALGEGVHLIDGDRENFKITTPLDLLFASALLDENSGKNSNFAR